MSSMPFRVTVVVDRTFGEKLKAIPGGIPVWIIDSPANRPAAESIWAANPEASHLKGITLFTSPEDASAEESMLNEIDMIDLHYGVHSADPPYSVLEVIGVAITDAIRIAIERNGFTQIQPLASGFRALLG